MKQSNNILRKLFWVTSVCLVFMTAEIIGGYLANSIAIIADALHLLSDVLAFGISAFSVWLSTRQPPKQLTFGYHKVQTLGALLNISVIWIVTGVLFIEATQRIMNRQKITSPKYMLITSIFGLLCNLVMMKILHNDVNFQHEGCNHNHGKQTTSRKRSQNVNLQEQSCSHGDHHGDHKHIHQQHKCKQEHHGKHKHQKDKHHHSHTSAQKHHCHSQHDHHQQHDHHDHHDHQEHQHHEQHDHQQHHDQKQHAHQQDHQDHIEHKCEHHGQKLFDNATYLKVSQKDVQLSLLSDCKEDEVIALASSNLLNHHNCDHHQNENHAHNQHDHKSDREKNLNLEAAYIHILGDIILSIGVIISALIIYMFTNENDDWNYFHLADPLCTYLFSVLVMVTTKGITKRSVLILLDGCCDEHLVPAIQAWLKHKNIAYTNLKVWSISQSQHLGSIKLAVESHKHKEQVMQKFKSLNVQLTIESH